MKNFDKFIIIVSIIGLLATATVNCMMFRIKMSDSKFYKVEVSRIEHELFNENEVLPENYKTITGVYEYAQTPDFYYSENEYVIRNINGKLYRIEYDDKISDSKLKFGIVVNAVFGFLLFLMISVLLYIRHNILKPFAKLSDYPYQLARGTLSVPLEESQSHYFGKFIWGLDMLRETLEKTEIRDLERIKREKTFLMSLSHDIKTPLSAIKLYSKAISKRSYSDRQKQIEAAVNIDLKADEIDSFVNEIIQNLSSDFMTFETNKTEFYLSQVIDRTIAYYADKIFDIGIKFTVSSYVDCLISGDPDRLEEILQNIIENAVKYGDGHYISISFSDEEECRLVTVSNSGCTLHDTELPHIFDSFWRGSNIGSKQGCGLGLYICRRLMNAMGGDVFAEKSDNCMNITLVCQKA